MRRDGLIRLKCDLHTHVIGDRPFEKKGPWVLRPKEFIDLASSLGYDFLSFTYHNYLYYDSQVWDYAEEKGIILIPGIERSIQRHHVLFFNSPHSESIRSFSSIRSYRLIYPGSLVVAPHPFYGSSTCLGKKLIENKDCFDAIEYCHFFTRWFNPNKKAVRVGKMFRIPLLGCSDAHRVKEFGKTFSYVYTEERSSDALIEAIKAGRVECVASPLPLLDFIKEAFWLCTRFRECLS